MLIVGEPGLFTTVQDLGREGMAHLGISRSGAADRIAHSLANRLVGNSEADATLEITARGPTIRIESGTVFAVTGAPCQVQLDDRPIRMNEATWARQGSVLSVGTVSHGLRAYIAFAGGIDERPILNSRSTDTLSGIGPAVIRAGRRLALGPVRSAAPASGFIAPRTASQARVVRLLLGPRDNWITRRGLGLLAAGAFIVAPTSNRIGVRLDGPTVEWARSGEMRSEGMVPGSVQIPPSGQPIILLADHPTTGGYPVAGVVTAHDLSAVAQLRPGDILRFSVQQPPPGPP
jgi:biotin-dependent carboxylase-like uncharacterized protein